MDDLIKRLKTEGKLRDQPVGFVQIEGMMKDALKDIQEAKAVAEIGERAPFLLAYQAMLKIGRALLMLQKLRPADGAQHRTVVQVCEVLLGSSFENLAEQFETMRRKRNELLYEFGGLLSSAEIEASLRDAEEWLRVISRKIKEKNPQFELPLE